MEERVFAIGGGSTRVTETLTVHCAASIIRAVYVPAASPVAVAAV